MANVLGLTPLWELKIPSLPSRESDNKQSPTLASKDRLGDDLDFEPIEQKLLLGVSGLLQVL